jgi:hypothetical protein
MLDTQPQGRLPRDHLRARRAVLRDKGRSLRTLLDICSGTPWFVLVGKLGGVVWCMWFDGRCAVDVSRVQKEVSHPPQMNRTRVLVHSMWILEGERSQVCPSRTVGRCSDARLHFVVMLNLGPNPQVAPTQC